jgi:hypothetical protein
MDRKDGLAAAPGGEKKGDEVGTWRLSDDERDVGELVYVFV